VNLITWFLVGLFIIIILGIVGNTGQSSVANIERQIFFINCPAPIYHGVATINSIEGLALNYTVDYGASTQDFQNTFNGTYFLCTFDPLSAPPGLGASTIIKAYGDTLFGFIPVGWLGYVSDWLTHGFQQLQALTTIIFFFVTPSNFDIMGFTIDDLDGIALIIMVTIYVFCYIPVVIFIYKAISPFVGGF